MNEQIQNKKYPKPLCIYRSKEAYQFSIGKDNVFLSFAYSSGNDNNGNTLYDWSNKRVLALNIVELGSMIYYIENYLNPNADTTSKSASANYKGDGIYHKNKNGNAQFYFKGNPDRKTPGFYFQFLSDKNGNKVKFQTMLSMAEVTTIKILLTQAIKIIHEWNLISN